MAGGPREWPVTDEVIAAAVRAWDAAVSGQHCCPTRLPPCYKPAGHADHHGTSTKDEWTRYGIRAAAPHIVAATLRQAAARYEAEAEAAVALALGAASFAGQLTVGQSWDGTRLVAEAEAVGSRLREWANEVQP